VRQNPRSYGVAVNGMVGPSTGGPAGVGFSVWVSGGASGIGLLAVMFESTMNVTPCESATMSS